jgi:hypothetical protein
MDTHRIRTTAMSNKCSKTCTYRTKSFRQRSQRVAPNSNIQKTRNFGGFSQARAPGKVFGRTGQMSKS